MKKNELAAQRRHSRTLLLLLGVLVVLGLALVIVQRVTLQKHSSAQQLRVSERYERDTEQFNAGFKFGRRGNKN